VLSAFHILNQFDIPRGSVRDKTDGGLELTQWTTVSDMHNLRWYLKTYDDETICVVDLKKAVAAANGQIRTIKMESEQPIVDASTTFMSGQQATDAEQ
jgi:choloylglycine hydrolase